MNALVLDASVAAKWFLPATGEPYVNEAAELLTRYAAGKVRFMVPDLFWAEMGNIFWKAVRLGRWSPKNAEVALRSVRERRFPTVSTAVLLEDAFAISVAFDRTICDSLYVTLAVLAKAQLVTADERLANALAAHFPVKWLGALI